MSLLPNEDRPKLKAKRFNKFEPSSLAPAIIDEDASANGIRQGYKRNWTDNESYINRPKRICMENNSNVQPSGKNLANNRLRNLKEEIQASVNTGQANKRSNTPTNSIFQMGYVGVTSGKLNKKETSTEQNNSFSQYVGPTPLNKTKKNLAQERLQTLKKKLISPDSQTRSPSVSDEGNTSLEITKRESYNAVASRKRNISDTITNDNSPMYRKVSRGHISSLHPSARTDVNSSFSEHTKVKNVPATYDSDAFASSTPVLNKLRCVKSTNNVFENTYNSSNLVASMSRSSPAIQESEIEKESIVQPQEPEEVTREKVLDLTVSFSSNFLSKMEMTASWIRNHQMKNDFGIPVEPTDNSLINVRKPFEASTSLDNDGNSRRKQTEDNRNFDICDEEMEWTNAEPDDEVLDPNKNVTNASNEEEEDKNIIKDPEKIKDLCIVVDTNVFISGLSKLHDILNLKTGSVKPIIFVPWMVITELDYMKDSCSNEKLSKNITNAIKFINTALQEKNPQVIGQTVFDVEKQKHIGTSPDDKIMSCCLQAAQKYETVILLSNDMNLKNKAMIHDITACSSHEIMMKLMSKLAKNVKLRKVMHKMGIMCSSVICDCMKAAYGDIWSKMDMMSNPPWSLADCLRRFKKYWSAVFREKLMKQFTKTVKNLQSAIEVNKNISDDSEEFVELTKLCVTLCVFLKDIEECRGFVENTLADITKIAS